MYVYCLMIFIHTIVACRECFPLENIFLKKIIYKSAYCIVNLNWKIAMKTIKQKISKPISLIALQITSGGTYCPREWIIISNISTNLVTTYMLQK